MDWTNEMSKMLSVFEYQTLQSLGVIKSSFRRNGMPFQSSFKEYFLRTANNRLSETFDRFEMESQLGDEMSGDSSDEVDEAEKTHNTNDSVREAMERSKQNVPEPADMANWNRFLESSAGFGIVNKNVSIGEARIESVYSSNPPNQIDDSDDEDSEMKTLEIRPSEESIAPSNANSNEIEHDSTAENTSDAYDSNDDLIATDDLHGTTESAAHQSSTNRCYTIDPDSKGLKFAVEVHDSNDSINMIENQNGSTDTQDSERVCYNVATKNEKFRSKQATSRNLKKCAVCCYTGYQLKRHMRIHSGDKPFCCEVCMKRFSRIDSLKRHFNALHA